MSARFFLLLYLLRDTLHRWSKRISSPLSRLLVVLSLSFCGLLFLSNYALSIRLLEEKITRSGADLLVVGEFLSREQAAHRAANADFSAVADEFELYVFNDILAAGKLGDGAYPIVEYTPELVKHLPASDSAIFVLTDEPTAFSGPADIDIEGHKLSASLLDEAHAGFLRKLYTGGAIFIPQGCLSLSSLSDGMFKKYVLRFHRIDVERVARWEQMFTLLSRLDKRNLTIASSRAMLQELEVLRSLQFRFRMGISLGCSFVIGLLLTSISSMEFRQNEYVYALMGSFGISRLSLVLTFVLENTLLVFAGFGIALLTLSNTGQYMVEKLYKMNDYTFSLDILREDIHLFLISFIFCILISSLPILASIFRPIGKILK